jgi:outer membrane lipoprotein-sorting protein
MFVSLLALATTLPVMSFPKASPASSSAAISVIEKALASYEGIKDYSCIYTKQEEQIDHMGLQKIRLYFRKPFDIRMEWIDEKDKVDQTVVYRQGFYSNKLRVKEGGILSLIPVLSIDPKSPRAYGPGSDSMHQITEFGVGNVLKRVLAEISKGQMAVSDLGNESVDGRNARKIEVVSQAAPGFHFAKKTILWIDDQTNFLIKHEHYNDKNQIFERHVYKDVKTNVGYGDEKFTL